jgi:hypothetical protein
MNPFHHFAQPTEELFLDPPRFASQSIPYAQQPTPSYTEYRENNPPPSNTFFPNREPVRQNWHVINSAPSYSSPNFQQSAVQTVPYHSSGIGVSVTPAGMHQFQTHPDARIIPARAETPDEDPGNSSEILSSAASTPQKRRPKQATQPSSKRQRSAMHPSQVISGARTR